MSVARTEKTSGQDVPVLSQNTVSAELCVCSIFSEGNTKALSQKMLLMEEEIKNLRKDNVALRVSGCAHADPMRCIQEVVQLAGSFASATPI